MNPGLQNLIGSIRNIPLNDGLSDDAVIALMNIHLSLMSMIVTNMLEDEFGDPEFHREAMNSLFAICSRRSRSDRSLARSSRMTPAMYHIFCMPDTLFDDRKHNACISRSFRMIAEWRRKAKRSAVLDERNRMIEYGILQSLLEAFAYIVDEDKECDKDFLYLRHRIAEWASEINDDGSWSGISDYDAIRQIDIMIGSSGSNGDKRYDLPIEKSLYYYFDKITDNRNQNIDCHTLFHLYWTMMWGFNQPDYQKIDTVTERAAGIIDSCTSGGDEWLWYAAVIIDRECVRIHNEIKREIQEYGA